MTKGWTPGLGAKQEVPFVTSVHPLTVKFRTSASNFGDLTWAKVSNSIVDAVHERDSPELAWTAFVPAATALYTVKAGRRKPPAQVWDGKKLVVQMVVLNACALPYYTSIIF